MSKKRTTVRKAKADQAEAIHVHGEGEETHVVGFKSLRVMLLPDSGQWFAQGLDLDYAASGATVDEAKKNIEDGLSRTVHEHLVLQGNIDKLLKIAPSEAWNEYLHAPPDTLKQTYSAVEVFKIVEKVPTLDDEELPENILPFDQVLFFKSTVAQEK